MSFYLQQGYGKSQKIATLNNEGHLGGIILSPADEDEATLAATARHCRALGLRTLVDSQAYIYTSFPKGTGRHHAAHRVQFHSIHWSQDAAAVREQIDAVGSLNERINPDGDWIAPSASQSSFADVWTPLSLQLARTASESWGGDRTIASIVLDEGAFASWAAIDDWLDVATTLDVRGFYILVGRTNTGYPPVAWAPDKLSNLMRLIYTLGVINDYEVIWGYSEAEGLLGLASGATHIASGWSFGLRQFSTNKWVPSTGGRPAVLRLPVPRLWASVRAPSEAEDLYNSQFRERVFSRAAIQEFQARAFDSMSRAEAQDRYLAAIAASAARVSMDSDVASKLSNITASLEAAEQLYREIDQTGIILEARYRPRVSSLIEAIRRFREAESI